MRKVKKVYGANAKLQMSSMIDVVFLILIYFIATQTVVIEETYLSTTLPGRGGCKIEPVVENPAIVAIGVRQTSGSNELYEIDGAYYKLDKLQDMLEITAENSPETTVIIKCGPNAKHQKLVSLLDACQKVELTNLSLVNDATIPFKGE